MPTAQAWVSMLLLFVRVFSGPKEWNSRHRIPRFFLFVFLWDVEFIEFNALLADCFRWVALLGVLGNYIIKGVNVLGVMFRIDDMGFIVGIWCCLLSWQGILRA